MDAMTDSPMKAASIERPGLVQKVDTLETCLAGLSEAIERLDNKLHPVLLSEEQPMGQDTAGIPMQTSPTTSRLTSLINQVQRFIGQIEGMNARADM